MPDPDDEGRTRSTSRCSTPRGKLTHRFLSSATSRPPIRARDRRRQRARGAPAPGRRASSSSTRTARSRSTSRVPRLAKVVYHNKLGTQGERVERVRALAARDRARSSAPTLRAGRARRAAGQGRPADRHGRRVPRAAGHHGPLLRAARRRAARRSPTRSSSTTGRASPATRCRERRRHARVALADKLETLVGTVRHRPACRPATRIRSALRRHALGVLRILIEKRLPLALPSCSAWRSQAFNGVAGDASRSADGSRDFIYDRLRGNLREQGYTRATRSTRCSSQRPQRLDLVPAQLEAVQAFAALPEAGALAAANKRIANILKKAAAKRPRGVDAALLTRGAERDLYAAFAALAPEVDARTSRAATTPARCKTLAVAKRAGRRLLRRRHGHGRRPDAARQPPGAAARRCTRR